MKVYTGIRNVASLNLTSVLNGGEWPATRSGRFDPDNLQRYPQGPTNWAGYTVRKEKSLTPAGFRNVMKNEGGNERKITRRGEI